MDTTHADVLSCNLILGGIQGSLWSQELMNASVIGAMARAVSVAYSEQAFSMMHTDRLKKN